MSFTLRQLHCRLQRCIFDYTAFSIVVQIGNTPMEKLFSL